MEVVKTKPQRETRCDLEPKMTHTKTYEVRTTNADETVDDDSNTGMTTTTTTTDY